MKTKQYLVIITSLLLFGQWLEAQDYNPLDYSLVEKPQSGPKVLGLEFGMREAGIANTLKEMGIERYQSRSTMGAHDAIVNLVYDKIPQGLAVNEGEMRLTFFQKELVRCSLRFPPTYENFLIIKSQLFRSLGKRFTIEKETTVMDDLLRAHLAMLGSGGFDSASEKAVIQALDRGNTFWYYHLKDTKGVLDVFFAFSSQQDVDGNPNPRLRLYYAWNQGMDKMKSYQKEGQDTILPE